MDGNHLPHAPNKKKRICMLVGLLIFVLVIGLLMFWICPFDKEPTITDLGHPGKALDLYFNAYNPWDMIVVDDNLYIGGGDYGVNTGPTVIWQYDIEEEKWQFSSSIVKDEAVSKFIRMGDTVLAPGIDPTTGSWDYGNYHRLVDETWETIETLPDAVHNYDIITFEGMTFFAIGTSSDVFSLKASTEEVSPVKMTVDHETYTDIPFYINGIEISAFHPCDFFRVYDFYIAQGELYCLFVGRGDTNFWAFCKYHDGAFEFVSALANHDIAYGGFWQDPFGPEVTFDETCYFTTGTLYKTNDFHEIEKINTPDNGFVTDILVEKSGLFQTEKMYILSTVETEDGTYDNTIWQYTRGGKFKKAVRFSTEMSALSFARYKDAFFVGLGKDNATNEAVGTILKID